VVADFHIGDKCASLGGGGVETDAHLSERRGLAWLAEALA